MANQIKTLHKFTDQSNNSIYIDLNSIVSLQEIQHHYNYNNGSSSTLGYPSPPPDYIKEAKTIIGIPNNTFYVMEHIAEVIALLEGRDPRPAQVMFGSSKKS